jgi:hypothetical protein
MHKDPFWIVWKHHPGLPPELKRYQFDTEAEEQAFVYGVCEADPDGDRHDFYDNEEMALADMEEDEDSDEE